MVSPHARLSGLVPQAFYLPFAAVVVLFRYQNSRANRKAIMRGVLSPPKPTPSNPVGGEVVYVSAPNPVWVEGFPGMPASTMLGSPKLGWLNTLKNCVSNRNFTRSVKGNDFVR